MPLSNLHGIKEIDGFTPSYLLASMGLSRRRAYMLMDRVKRYGGEANGQANNRALSPKLKQLSCRKPEGKPILDSNYHLKRCVTLLLLMLQYVSDKGKTSNCIIDIEGLKIRSVCVCHAAPPEVSYARGWVPKDAKCLQREASRF